MNIRKVCTILVVILMLLTTSVSAYSTDSYSVDISTREYEVSAEEGLTLFQKESGDNIVIQHIKQKVIGGKLTKYQLNAIFEEIKEQYKEEHEATVEEISREDITINEHNVTRMVFKTNLYGQDIYQEMNIFVSSDSIYDIIFSSITEEGFSDEEKNNILNSFKMLSGTTDNANVENTNSTVSTEMNQVWIELGIVVILAIILIIIAIKRNPKSKLYLSAIVLIVLQGVAIKLAELQGMTANDIMYDPMYNMGFFAFAIIGLILLVIQLCKNPKEEITVKQESEEPKETISREPEDNITDEQPKENNDNNNENQ